MMKKSITSLLLLSACLTGWSQTYQKTSYGVKTTINGLNIELQFYTPTTVRAIKYPVGGNNQQKSFSIIAKPSATTFTVVKEANGLLVQGAAVKVRVDSKTGKLSYYTSANKLLLAEKDSGGKFTPVVDAGQNTYAVSQEFTIPANEAIYGLGQHQKGIMNYRNNSVELRQQNMDIAVPFIQSSAGYGIFWDNTSTTLFKDEAGVTTLSSDIGDCTDYYFMNGGDADHVIAQMRTLTGNAPMFPRWVYGFFQSRERYRSQTEVVGIIKKYRDLKVPLDGIVQDWQYWGSDDSVWNAVEFGNPLFRQPEKMIDSVHALNAHIIISVWPSFGPKTAIHKSMQDVNALFDFKTWPTTPGVNVYDPFNPKARDIYWEYMNRNLFSLGMDGWWLDATEPEQANTKVTDKSVTYAGSFKKVSNAFPLLTTGGVYDHQRKQSMDKRVFILTRSAFAGQQRYATATWSGDIQGNWQSFRNQLSGGLNLSLSAIPYWNTDIGGFFSATAYPHGVKDLTFHEVSRSTGIANANFNTVKSKQVYLPKGSQWIDFWTGDVYAGGNTIECKTPIDEIPLFVKAGSIVPFGPYQQYTSEKKADNLEVRIYPGANGAFTLYEDENNNYNYEKGIYSTIDMVWNDKTQTLTISKYKGTFPGMLSSRIFSVVKVDKTNGIGIAPAGKIRAVNYNGESMSIKL